MPRAMTRIAFALLLALTGPLADPPAAGAQAVPTPESVLGYRPGADFRLATYEESLDYFQRLDAASDRLTLVQVGTTSFGRPWWMALVSSPENLRNVERHREIARRLADPRGLSDEQARALAREGRAIVDVNGGLHASESAGAQHTIQLAYDLVAGADTDARTASMLDEVIVALWPSLNPDGQTLVSDWYEEHVGTPFETSPTPFLYQKYIGHDNNRDAYMLNMEESRVLARTWRAWEPQIIYVHHQSSPFPTRIWLPPFAEPIAEFAPPLMSRTVNTLGMTIAQMLEARGMPGAVHMGTGFDAWYPGYVDYLPMLQHQAAFWTETALYRYATPNFYTLDDFPEGRRDLRAESLYPSPWTGGWWRLADAVDYMRVASVAVIEWASKYREDLLYNRYQSGRDVVARYTDGPPYAYLVSPDQRDPVAAVEMLRRLAFNGVDVHELAGPVTHQGLAWPAGTWVVAMDQPFAELVRQLLEMQRYPDLREYPEGPPEQPYDAAGWTLSEQMGVRVVAATEPLGPAVRAAMRSVDAEAVAWDADVADASGFDMVGGVGFDTDPTAAGIRPPAGRLTGSGPAIHFDPGQNNTYRALNAAWEAGASVRLRTPDPGSTEPTGGAERPARYVVSGLDAGAADRLVADLALHATRGPSAGLALPRARLGLYRPWTASMDEGWSRWLMERYGFDFANVRDADVRAGDLRSRYDVIVLPAERPGSLLEGHAPGTMPSRYTGGLGADGIRSLDEFVRAGGTLVCMNQASDLCIAELHLPVQNAVDHLGRQDFFSSGSILEVRVDTGHPLMAGMPERAPVFFDRSPVFRPLDTFRGSVLAAYQPVGSPLVSGYLLGQEHLNGLAAAVDVRHGNGHVVLLGFRPQWRGQPFGTFRTLFNAALFTGEVAAAATGTDGFWSPPAAPAEEGTQR
ncbi:MAG: M14 family metallopeptidase [Longimicrobiales bacterium]